MPVVQFYELDSSDDGLQPNDSFCSAPAAALTSLPLSIVAAKEYLSSFEAVIPKQFPTFDAANLFSERIKVKIIGMSSFTALKIPMELHFWVRVVINFTTKNERSTFTSYVWQPWQQPSDSAEPFYKALEIANTYLNEQRAPHRAQPFPAVGFYCNSEGCTATVMAAYMLTNEVMLNRDETSLRDYFFQPRERNAQVTIYLYGTKIPAPTKVSTTPLIAKAVDMVKNLTDAPILMIRYNQIKVLESFEDKIARAFCMHFDKPFIGISQVGPMKVNPSFQLSFSDRQDVYFDSSKITPIPESPSQTQVGKVDRILGFLRDVSRTPSPIITEADLNRDLSLSFNSC